MLRSIIILINGISRMMEKGVKTKGNRIAGYENIKFFLMFLVVFGHVLENEYSFENAIVRSCFFGIYFFHMPAFIFLSGLMQKVDAPLSWKKVLSFVILGYCYKIMITLVTGFGTGKWSFSFLKENGIPWFMFVMALCPIFVYVVKSINPIFMLSFSIALGCMAGFDKCLVDGILVLGRTIVYFPFYLLGCYLDAEKLLGFCKRKVIRGIAAVTVLVYLGIIFTRIDKVYKLRHILTGKNAYSEWALEHSPILLRLGCYAGAFVLIITLISLIPDRKFPIITSAGGRTLGIYFWHRIILYLLKYSGAFSIIKRNFGNEVWFGAVFALILCIILSRKIFSVPVNYVMKGMYKR